MEMTVCTLSNTLPWRFAHCDYGCGFSEANHQAETPPIARRFGEGFWQRATPATQEMPSVERLTKGNEFQKTIQLHCLTCKNHLFTALGLLPTVRAAAGWHQTLRSFVSSRTTGKRSKPHPSDSRVFIQKTTPTTFCSHRHGVLGRAWLPGRQRQIVVGFDQQRHRLTHCGSPPGQRSQSPSGSPIALGGNTSPSDERTANATHEQSNPGRRGVCRSQPVH